MTVGGLILAAGASRRFGRPKMLLPLGRGTVLSSVVAPHLEAGLDPVVVVLGADSEAVRAGAGLPADPRLRVVVNEDWARGMSSSLRRGLWECRSADAVVVALGDQPGVTAERIRALMAAWTPGTPLVVPVHGGRAGHPVLFARSLFDELEALRGDVGAREVVRRHWAQAAQVSAVALLDIDIEADYAALRQGAPARADEGLELP
jgi:CTP:molybdopterin cytidylyltransferase MocA